MAKRRGRMPKMSRGNTSQRSMAKMTRKGVRNNHAAVHRVMRKQGS